MNSEKQQVMHVHGGSPWGSYDRYLEYLRTKEVGIVDTIQTTRWHYNYLSFLSPEFYEVIRPEMPCKQNAHYLEWKIWFERHLEFLRDDIILVGHSLGGNFLAKYLSENVFPISIKQLHLVAPSHSAFDDDFKITNFPKDFNKNIVQEIHIYHSSDDTVVPITESEKYHTQLPGSQFHRFTDRFHFIGEDFPELFDHINKSL